MTIGVAGMMVAAKTTSSRIVGLVDQISKISSEAVANYVSLL
jgi:hypothetical protein